MARNPEGLIHSEGRGNLVLSVLLCRGNCTLHWMFYNTLKFLIFSILSLYNFFRLLSIQALNIWMEWIWQMALHAILLLPLMTGQMTSPCLQNLIFCMRIQLFLRITLGGILSVAPGNWNFYSILLKSFSWSKIILIDCSFLKLSHHYSSIRKLQCVPKL